MRFTIYISYHEFDANDATAQLREQNWPCSGGMALLCPLSIRGKLVGDCELMYVEEDRMCIPLNVFISWLLFIGWHLMLKRFVAVM